MVSLGANGAHSLWASKTGSRELQGQKGATKIVDLDLRSNRGIT